MLSNIKHSLKKIFQTDTIQYQRGKKKLFWWNTWKSTDISWYVCVCLNYSLSLLYMRPGYVISSVKLCVLHRIATIFITPVKCWLQCGTCSYNNSRFWSELKHSVFSLRDPCEWEETKFMDIWEVGTFWEWITLHNWLPPNLTQEHKLKILLKSTEAN